MLRSEFDHLLQSYGRDPKEVSQEWYKTIEMVYCWYPVPEDVLTKELVVFLYVRFGMMIFEDMEARALNEYWRYQ